MSKIKSLKWRLWLKSMLLALIVLWLLVFLGLISIIHYTGTIDEAHSADVIIVLGAGLTRSGRPDWALTGRSTHAAELWQQGYADKIICTGGVGNGQTRSEADACREVLNRHGVPSSVIFLEDKSRSTEENAIFSYQIMQANHWQTALLVSDSYHVFRARYIFASEGMDVFLSPVPAERIRSRSFYISSVLREVAALHWQLFKNIFNLQVTHVPIV
jgi:uncharacterized SAM-binding protein YcdF (DUF218 family)